MKEFLQPSLWDREKDAERTNRAKTRRQTCFCLPEGVQRYVEWRGLFVAQNTSISFFIKK